jgi:hypothetical protein
MKKLMLCLFIVFLINPLSSEEKRDVLVKKYFRDDNTFIIICKGYPKEGLEGKMAVSTAKEAALLNAQIIAKETFKDSVNIFKKGNVENYDVQLDYVIITYVIKQNGLKKLQRK